MDRVTAVKARLDHVMTVAREAMEVGPPCVDCRFKRFGTCRNPAYAEPTYDAALGVYEEKFTTSLTRARAGDGLCGPEALLFEPQFPVIVAAKGFASGLKKAWLIAAAILLGITFLSILR